MKTVVAHFESADMADLAAKALKDKGLITQNIDINEDMENSDGGADYDYFILPLFSLSYSTPFVLPYFPGIVPFADNNVLSTEHNEDDDEQVVFAAKCSDEDASKIEALLLSHSGFNTAIY